MVVRQMRPYDEGAFGIERHGTDGHPVSSVARPARRVAFPSDEVQGMPGSQNRMVVPSMAAERG
jgi:hypothetical protein